MNVWLCLFKKEFRLRRTFLIVNVLALLAVGIVGTYLAFQFHSGFSSLFLFVTMIWHIFYLAAYLLTGFKAEKNCGPIWMQSPQPAWMLLFVKFAAGLVMMYTSIALNLALWLWVWQLDFQNGMYQGPNGLKFLLAIHSLIVQHWGFIALVFTQKAIWLASLLVFIYIFADAFKYLFGGWRWVLRLILFIAMVGFNGWFSTTAVYDSLFHWGIVNTLDFTAFASSEWSSNPHFSRNPFWGGLYLGGITFGLLLSAIWFYAAAWLFDRKVEV